MDRYYKYSTDTYNEVDNISKKYGMSVDDVIGVFLARIRKEKSLDFLFKTQINNGQTDLSSEKRDMTKTRAMNLFILKGYDFSEYITFASKNTTANNYWANPDISCLNHDWSIILNNWIDKQLYLFQIPAHAVGKFDLQTRRDKPYTIDLQIVFNDPLFTDGRSQFSFKKYLVEVIDY